MAMRPASNVERWHPYARLLSNGFSTRLNTSDVAQ